MFESRPPKAHISPNWDLNVALDYSRSLFPLDTVSLPYLLMKCIFMLALATGKRCSELHAISRSPNFLRFARRNTSVFIQSNPGFLAKTESLTKRPDPFEIPALFDKRGKPHRNCPVMTLRAYLDRTSDYKGPHLFINPTSKIPMSRSRIAMKFKKFIKIKQDSLPHIHDMRKMGSSIAFWAGMSVQDILKRGQWNSKSIFIKAYLEYLTSINSSCIALGNSVNNLKTL
jgi:integrase